MVLRMQMALGAFAILALIAPAALAQQAASQPVSTLPPPPYARDAGPGSAPRRPASYGGEQAYDRYGGGTMHPRVSAVTAQVSPPAPAAYTGPRLGWTGKAEVAAASAQGPAPYGQARASGRPGMAYALQGGAPPAAPRATIQPAFQQAAARPPQQRAFAAIQPAAPQGWTFVPPIGSVPSAAPTSIYDSPPQAPAAPPVQVAKAAQAQTGQIGARHYSVNREFGQQPDPIPLPPQFFGATADLTQPATDEPERKVTTANGKTRNAVQPEGGQ